MHKNCFFLPHFALLQGIKRQHGLATQVLCFSYGNFNGVRPSIRPSVFHTLLFHQKCK